MNEVRIEESRNVLPSGFYFHAVATFECSYNGCLEVILNLISQQPDRYKIIVATHNEESVRKAVTWYGIMYTRLWLL